MQPTTKHAAWRTCLERAAGLIKARIKPSRPASVYEEMQRGSIIGVLACVPPTALAGLPGVLLWAAAAGSVAGALIGLLLWLGTSEQHDETVLPPHRPPERKNGE